MRSVPALIRVLFAAAAVVAAMPVLADTRVALVIANSRYRDSSMPTVANDGRQVAEALRRLGIVTVLIADADGRAVDEAIARFEQTARSADVALVYYAGHALQFGERNYLVPVDAHIATERDIATLPAVDRLLDAMRDAKSRILVLDACHDTSALLPTVRDGARNAARRALARIDAPRDTMVLLSSAPGQVVLDGSGETSVFATALLEEIRAPISVEDVANRTRLKVARATGGAQVPWISSSMTEEVFLAGKSRRILGKGKARPPSVSLVPIEPPRPPPPPPPPPSSPRRETQVLPPFPWPPPAASVSYLLPKSLVARHGTIGALTDAIIGALEKSGYVERSFYDTPVGGVVLMTRLERIDEDGAPASADHRWAEAPRQADAAGLTQFLRGLFFANPGRYRVIVFVIQDQPFTQDTDKTISGDQARKMLSTGANALPREVATRPLAEPQCTALIYEFSNDGIAMKRVESRLTARQHLEKAGIIAQLERAN